MNIFKKTVFLIFPFLILSGLHPGFAQSATNDIPQESLSLEACIQYALKNSKTLQNSRFEMYISEHQAKEVLATGLPQLKATGDLNYFVKLPVSILPGTFSPEQQVVTVNSNQGPVTIATPKINPDTGQPIPGPDLEAQFGTPWQSTGGFELSQLVFDGTFFLGLKASKTFVELSEKNLKATAEDIAVQVSKAYYSALIAQESMTLFDANIARVKKLYEDTEALNKEGFAEKIDVERLQINYTNLLLERTKAERMAQLSKDLLKFQMGMPVYEEVILADDISDIELDGLQPESGLNFDPTSRIEYSMLQTQEELETMNMKRYKAGYMPSLYAFGSYKWNAQRDEFDFFNFNKAWFPIGVVGLQLDVPIFDGFRKKNQIAQSKLKLQTIKNNQDLLTQSISLELKNTYAQLLNQTTNLEVYKKNKELAKKVFNVTEIKYKEGVGSSLELNDAENQLKESESAYLNAMFEYLNTKVDYQKARGVFSKYQPEITE